MAQPIPFVVPQRDDDCSKEAVRSALELLQLLHERGVLSLFRGLLGAGDQVVDIVTSAIDTPDAIRGVRNFLLLTKFFATFPPEVLNSLVQTAVAGANPEKENQPPGLLQLLRRLNNANTRHALAVVLDLAESVGKGL
jgi:uncharacterized protein YjgD (DUF1641 family)